MVKEGEGKWWGKGRGRMDEGQMGKGKGKGGRDGIAALVRPKLDACWRL